MLGPVKTPSVRRRRSFRSVVLTIKADLLRKYRNRALTPDEHVWDAELERFGARPSRMMTSGDWQLDRRMRDVFVRMHSLGGTVPSEAISDIRRGRQAPWRYLARRIREAARAGVPKTDVDGLVRELADYIDEVYDAKTAVRIRANDR